MFVVLTVTAFVLPLAGLALALRALPDGLAAASPSIRPVLVDARQAQMDGRVLATAELKWVDGTALAPAWSGVVTAVALAAGQAVRLRDEPYRFRYADLAVELDPKRSAFGDAVMALGKAVDSNATSVDGYMRLVEGYTAVSVPVTAVQSGADSGLCVHLQQADGYRTVDATVVGGGIGTAEITRDAHGDVRVLANPARLGLACP
jgi:hypothetical protein